MLTELCSADILHTCRGTALETGYRANLWLRSAIRYVIQPPADAVSSLRSIPSFGLVPMCLQPGTALLVNSLVRDGHQRDPHVRHAAACRVLALVGEGRLDPGRAGGDEVYRLTRRAAPWASLLGPGQTVGVEARVHGCTDVPSALLARARVRDAVCDSVSDARCFSLSYS